jgi:hypothetical protein
LIPATIVAEWVKGHYNGEHREHKHDLNEMADKLATNFNAHPPPTLKQMRMPCLLPGYAIRLVYDGSTITNKLYKTMSIALHGQKFVSYLKQKHNWTDHMFRSIHWNAHERAFKSHTRTNQIMIAKIIHNLVNTNYQNNKFYGKSPLCPCCQTSAETLQHILSCTSQGSTETREAALRTLETDLTSINTPPQVTEAIAYGIQTWINNQNNEQTSAHAPTVGSLRGPDVLLTAAFHEQYHSIGWYHLFMGRLSKK